MNFKSAFLLFLQVIICINLHAQVRDSVYKSSIYTPQLTMFGNNVAIPLYTLNSGDRLMLGFDDMDSDVKSYYYTYQLCDYNWMPVDLNPFDYIKGFTQNRISNYKY